MFRNTLHSFCESTFLYPHVPRDIGVDMSVIFWRKAQIHSFSEALNPPSLNSPSTRNTEFNQKPSGSNVPISDYF